MTDRLNTCKDAQPADTLLRIKEILQNQGIETQEDWSESGVPYCHSVHIRICGTPFGTNGKGVTRELALASGYGELMERLQLGYLVKTAGQKAILQEDTSAEEQTMEQLELLNSGILDRYTALAKQATGVEITPLALLHSCADAQEKIPVTPFYSVTENKDVFLPTALRRSIYTTNGCAAGNTMEEAMVQAISEIVERHYKGRILAENIPLPDISEDTLKSCPISWDIIDFLRKSGLTVTVKDCSLGGKFPVVCVCLVDRRTGRYHTHFGAFPVFEIALLRTLTESFQGRNLEQIGQYEDFATDNQALNCLMKELVNGTAEKTPEFFLNTAGCHVPAAGFRGTDNRALLAECLDFFRAQGLDLWVRDCSCLGFPTCQVIIPGYSEIFPHRLSPRHSDSRYAPLARKVLRSPATARPDEQMGLIMHLAQSKASGLGLGSFLGQANLAAQITPKEDGFLLHTTLAYVNYNLSKTADTLQAIRSAITRASETDAGYLICLMRYLTLCARGYEQEKVRALLDTFHRAETVQALYDLLEQQKNPLDPLVLHCDGQCRADCRLASACRQRSAEKLAALVNQKQANLSQTALKSLLRKQSFLR